MAEAVTFSRISTGAVDDLRKVTQLAYRQVAEAGMSEQVGHISFPSQSEVAGRRPYSKWLAGQIDGEVQRMVSEATAHTEAVLRDNQHSLEKLAKALLEREVLNYSDLVELLGPLPYSKAHLHSKELVDMW